MLFSAPRRLCAPSSLRPVVSAPRRLCAPSSLRLLAAVGLIACGLASAFSKAYAGSYSPVVYTGGTLAYTGSPIFNNPGGQQLPFAFNSTDGYYEDSIGSSCSPDAQRKATTCSATASAAPITAKFTWQAAYPSEPIPTSVIVFEKGYASGNTQYANGNGTNHYVCQDGLGDSFSGSGTGGCGGTKWSGPSPAGDGSVSLTCTSSSAYTGNSGTVGTNGQSPFAAGIVYLGYAATVSPVTISLGGTYKSTQGDNHVLTGQQITATLNGIPSGSTVTSYAWSITPSATCFKTYNPALTSNQLVALGPSDLTGPAIGSASVAALAFYDRVQEDLTITCAVTMTAPDGKTVLNVSATSPKINVLKPSLTKWDIYTGYVQQVQEQVNGQPGQAGFALKPAPTSTQAGGEAWSNTTIVVPPPFAATGGMGCFAQLATPDVTVTNDTPSKSPVFPNNKQQGLDNSFPYKGYSWAVSGLGAGFDGPALLFENYNSGGYAGWSQVSDSDSYTTWVMYQPPGGVWVPLKSYDWSWYFVSKWDNSLNQWTLFRANPPYATSDPGYKGTDTPNPPQWNLVQTNT